jgi:hypothetical protein
MFGTSKKLLKLSQVTKMICILVPGRSQIQTPEIAITFYYRIVAGHTEFPHCMLLFDKSDKRSTQLETAVIKI